MGGIIDLASGIAQVMIDEATAMSGAGAAIGKPGMRDAHLARVKDVS